MTDLLAATTMSTATTPAAVAVATSDEHIATPLSDARSQLAEAVGLLGLDRRPAPDARDPAPRTHRSRAAAPRLG